MASLRPTAIRDLKLGDLVDLEGDKYADPNRDNIAFQNEYQTVDSLEHETVSCIAVGFEGFDVVGMPPDHVVDVFKPDYIRRGGING